MLDRLFARHSVSIYACWHSSSFCDYWQRSTSCAEVLRLTTLYENL
jgi:hypothetical protein